MKKVKQYKLDKVQELVTKKEEQGTWFFVDYRGLNVEQLTQIRIQLGQMNAEIRVVKNTYLRFALQDTSMGESLTSCFQGPTAVIFTQGDGLDVLKFMVKFLKKANVGTLKAGFVEQDVMNGESILVYAKLPGKTQLYQQLLGVMQAPAAKMVGTLQASSTALLRVLNAYNQSR